MGSMFSDSREDGELSPMKRQEPAVESGEEVRGKWLGFESDRDLSRYRRCVCPSWLIMDAVTSQNSK